MRSKKAFTLIELLVVIAIIGFVSSIVIVNLQGTRGRAKESRMGEFLYQVELAAGLDHEKYENWSPDVCPVREGLGGCPASCVCQSDPPRFVQEGILPSLSYNNIQWYCPDCCFDWQVWDGGDYVSIDVYDCSTGSVVVTRRRCIYDAPGGHTCTNF